MKDLKNSVPQQKLFIIFIAACALGVLGFVWIKNARPIIKVGILHSLTGNLAFSEKTMVDAELMAIEEINAQGGILGRKIVPIIRDGKSDEEVFAREAASLITDQKVMAIIGCWTSTSRRTVKQVVEKYNSIFVYPVTSEGAEDSKNILLIGAAHNQQVIPCALWSFYNLGKKFFLIGSEEIYSHISQTIIKDVLSSVGAEIVGEEYILLDTIDIGGPLDKIAALKPDVIINTIQGDAVVPFFEGLRARGITPEKIPVMSIASVSETEFAALGSNAMAGDYVTASYFQSVEREENIIFVRNFKKKYGAESVVSDWTQSAYLSVYMWAEAVKAAQSPDPLQVLAHAHNRVVNAPEGIVYVDNELLSTWKRVLVGKLRADGQFSIVWDSIKQVEPLNFPIFREKKEWEQLVNDLYIQWGNRWSKVTAG